MTIWSRLFERRHATTARPGALLLLGMYRSGFSVLGRTLQLVGEPSERGRTLPASIEAIHGEALRTFGAEWCDLRPIDRDWILRCDRGLDLRDRLAAAVKTEFGDAAGFVIADPRLCRVLPLWHAALEQLNIEVRHLLLVRNPLEVAGGMCGAPDSTLPLDDRRFLQLLWLRYTLDAEAASRRKLRAVLTFDGLVADWQATLLRCGREIGVRWEPCGEAVASEDGPIVPALRRQRATTVDLDTDLVSVDWAATCYRELANTASLPDYRKLDRIAAVFDASESVYRGFVRRSAAIVRRAPENGRDHREPAPNRAEAEEEAERVAVAMQTGADQEQYLDFAGAFEHLGIAGAMERQEAAGTIARLEARIGQLTSQTRSLRGELRYASQRADELRAEVDKTAAALASAEAARTELSDRTASRIAQLDAELGSVLAEKSEDAKARAQAEARIAELEAEAQTLQSRLDEERRRCAHAEAAFGRAAALFEQAEAALGLLADQTDRPLAAKGARGRSRPSAPSHAHR